jgi:hypothetical protein
VRIRKNYFQEKASTHSKESRTGSGAAIGYPRTGYLQQGHKPLLSSFVVQLCEVELATKSPLSNSAGWSGRPSPPPSNPLRRSRQSSPSLRNFAGWRGRPKSPTEQVPEVERATKSPASNSERGGGRLGPPSSNSVKRGR